MYRICSKTIVFVDMSLSKIKIKIVDMDEEVVYVKPTQLKYVPW
jgi:hypothetical protein